MKKTNLVLTSVLALAVVASGCAKGALNPLQQQQNTGVMLAQALQLPAPDNSYTVQQTGQALQSGFNVGSVLIPQIFDKLAIAMRESNLHLYQTMTQGASSNNSLTLTLASLGTSLVGKVNSAQGSISYTYTVNGSQYASNNTYFTGSAAVGGTSGSLSFPGNANADALTVSYNLQSAGGQLTKNITVVNARWGSVNFVETFSSSTTVPDSVKMTYSINNVNGSGSWTSAAGGSFTDVGGTKRCFNSALVDVNPCN